MEDQQAVHAREGVSAPAMPSAEEHASFDVSFQKMPGSRTEALLGRFRGKGRIDIRDGQIIFSGRRGLLSGLSRAEQVVVSEASVFNVRQRGNLLVCQIIDGQVASYWIKIATADATSLAARLPTQQTPKFAATVAEHADFHARLNAMNSRATVVPVLIAINIVVFIAMCVNGVDVVAPKGSDVIRWGSNYGPLTAGGQWWRLLSNTFLHFGVLHIALNMWALYASGRTAERLFGSARFLVLYLFSGIAASMVSLLWNPNVNSAGASGAIFGVFGGMLAFVLNKRNDVPPSIMAEHLNSTLGFVGYSLFYGMVHSHIDNAAHVGGLAAGLMMGAILARPLTRGGRRPANPASFGLAFALGLLALLTLSWPIAHPSAKTLRERQYAMLFTHLRSDEQAAYDVINKLNAQATSEGWSRDRLASSVSKDVVPKLDAIYQEVAAVPLQPGDYGYARHQLLLEYCDARRRQYSQLSLAWLTNDATLEAESTQEKNLAEKLLQQLNSTKAD